MRKIALVRVGAPAKDLLESIAPAISAELQAEVILISDDLNPDFARDPDRGQYNSTEIVIRLRDLYSESAYRILGLADVDLFIPILTFVFGEAQLGCCAAVASLHRLRQEFYGLPPDRDLLLRRVIKEALHELGHTYGLRHCPDYNCVMHSSNTVDEVDVKGDSYCESCQNDISSYPELPAAGLGGE